jgi:hypothetical protein
MASAPLGSTSPGRFSSASCIREENRLSQTGFTSALRRATLGQCLHTSISVLPAYVVPTGGLSVTYRKVVALM